MSEDERDSEPPSDSELDSGDDFLRAVARAPDAAPPSSEDLVQLGPFRIVERIGRGGMGIVYRAEDEKLRRTVALKVLPEDFSEDGHRKKRFLREARVAASIAHPNVATIHEVGEIDGRVYIAMELVNGTTLRRRLEDGALPVAEAVRVAKDITRGVGKAHARGIAHRDLKPDNVMVSEDGSVKVLDFGLAKPVEREADSGEQSVTVTQEGRIIGTPGYMSPEQATGRAVDVRTDVFAIGVVLYEMLTATRPFKGQTSMEALIATSRDAYVPASKVNAKVPPSIDRVIARCLEKDPADRYATADALLAALDALDAEATRATPRWAWAALAVAVGAVGAWKMMSAPAAVVAPRPEARPEPVVASAAPAATTEAPRDPAPVAPSASSSPKPVVRPAVVDTRPRIAIDAGAPPPHKPSAEPGSPGGVIEKSPY